MIHGGRELEEVNFEGTLVKKILNKFVLIRNHISFTSRFASACPYLEVKSVQKSLAAVFICGMSAQFQRKGFLMAKLK